MAKLLFRLHDVPDDEANDIRQLMNEHQLQCYETSEGKWRVGVAAIWLIDESRFDEARALINAYENERYQRVHFTAEEKPLSFGQYAMQHPIHVFMGFIALAFVLFLSVYPFLAFR
jgi:hypothetical protein